MHFFQQILHDLDVKYTVPYAKALFESRNDANTLYGIKKILEQFGLSFYAIKVNAVEEIEYPCICIYRGTIMVLKSRPEECEKLVGEIILMDKGRAKEPGYISNIFRLVLRTGMPYLTVASVLTLITISFLLDPLFDFHKLILLILNSMGLVFSWRTLVKECSGTCKELLESSASKLFGLYSLGIIGLSYFISSLLIVLFIPLLTPVLALISCAALVMPIWNLAYQRFRAGAWCKNCVGVQVAVVSIFITELLYGEIHLFSLGFTQVIATISLYIILFFSTDRFYSFVQKNKEYPKELLPTYFEMMRDTSIREKIFSTGEYCDTTDSSTIIVQKSSNEKPQELTFVISLFCDHCRQLFLRLHEMIVSGQLKEYNIRLVFALEQEAC